MNLDLLLAQALNWGGYLNPALEPAITVYMACIPNIAIISHQMAPAVGAPSPSLATGIKEEIKTMYFLFTSLKRTLRGYVRSRVV